MVSGKTTVRIAGVDLRLGTALHVHTVRERPGAQEFVGTTDGPPDVAGLRSQLADAGFVLLTDWGGPGSNGFALVSHRDAAVVTINFSGAPDNMLLLDALDHDAISELHVEDGAFAWGGVEWPAYFVAGRITRDTAEDFMIEADFDDADRTIERYRAWARANGFEIEDPPAGEHEPDLRTEHGVGFRNAAFEVQVSIVADTLNLFIAAR